MTLVMLLLHRQLNWQEKHPLPPEDITDELAQRAGIAKYLGRSEQQTATWVAHFAFGAGAGALYAPLSEKVGVPSALKGATFGLLVWAVSYLGWLRGAGIIDQPKQQPARSNLLMIVAHLVWGAILGILAEQIETD